MRLRRWSSSLFAVVALVAVTSCASDNTDPNVASKASATGAPLAAFDQCMRDNGAPPLEGVSGGVEGGSGQGGNSNLSPQDRLKQEEALKKCRQFLPNGGNPDPISTAEFEKMRLLAKCMREAGYPYPDPDPNSGGPGTVRLPEGVDFKDPVVLAKYRDCARNAGIGTVNGSPGAAPGTNP